MYLKTQECAYLILNRLIQENNDISYEFHFKDLIVANGWLLVKSNGISRKLNVLYVYRSYSCKWSISNIYNQRILFHFYNMTKRILIHMKMYNYTLLILSKRLIEWPLSKKYLNDLFFFINRDNIVLWSNDYNYFAISFLRMILLW